MVLLVRYRTLGVHVHCRVFSAPSPSMTFEKHGDLVFDERQWPEAQVRLEMAGFDCVHEDSDVAFRRGDAVFPVMTDEGEQHGERKDRPEGVGTARRGDRPEGAPGESRGAEAVPAEAEASQRPIRSEAQADVSRSPEGNQPADEAVLGGATDRVTAEDLDWLTSMIDRDFATIAEQDRADAIVAKLRRLHL